MSEKTTRRNFMFAGATIASSLVGAGLSRLWAGFPRPYLARQVPSSPAKSAIPERLLGNTDVSVPILGLGGAGQTPLSWEGKEAEARQIIEKAIELGIRYFDTAASYGPSEDYLGKVLPQYRSQILLASKTSARDRDGAWRDLERSLKRLNTDYLDFWQLHHVSFHEEIDDILSDKGAIQAIEEAKAQKLIKFTGITGHHEPDVIAAGLQRYPFDTTLVSINAADIHHPRPFSTTVLPVAKEKNVGVVAMKIPAYGRLFKNGVLSGMDRAMGYTLSLDGVHSCIIAAETPQQLEANVLVARAFQPLTSQEMSEIERQTEIAWEDNSFFRKWT
jgi:aryl-alcohol dehydrogenase-like predicted oxidoreductase